MTSRPCANPNCPNNIVTTKRGRPPKHCSEECKKVMQG